MDCIEIAGYKSIKKAEIAMRPINILIGANGSGKSNFLSFFDFLNVIYEQKLANYVALSSGIEKILHKGPKITEQIEVRVGFKRRTYSNAYSFVIKHGESGFIFTKEDVWYQDDPKTISSMKPESQLKLRTELRARFVREYLEGLKKYHFHDTGKNSPFTKTSHIENDVHFLYEKGENLAAFLFNIRQKEPKIYSRIVTTIQSIAPYFSDFYFQPNAEGYVKLQWQDKFCSTTYGATDLSDGTIRFIALATLFLQPKLPASIIIDEPELGLHPFAIAKLAGMMKSVAERGAQVIVSTQSVELVNYFSAEDIITVDQQNGESMFNRLKTDDLAIWLEEYSIGDLWQKNIIQGGQPA